MSCDFGWDFPNASEGHSIVDEFQLVCAKAWVPGFMMSIFNVGQAIAGIVVQPLADK